MKVVKNADFYEIKLAHRHFAVCDHYFSEHQVEVRIWNSPEWDFYENPFIVSFMMKTVEKFLSYLNPGYFRNQLHIDIAYWCHEKKCPCTLDTENLSSRIVLLSADLNHQSQFIYQLAHELIHCFQQSDSRKNNWFSEMLGELAGNFFMKDLKNHFYNFPDLCNDITEFQNLTDLALADNIKFPLEWFKRNKQHLLNYTEDRPLNAQFAKLLLHYLLQEPYTWNTLLSFPKLNLDSSPDQISVASAKYFPGFPPDILNCLHHIQDVLCSRDKGDKQ